MKANLDLTASFNQMSQLNRYDGSFLESNKVSPPEKFEGRKGYLADFLNGWEIPFPKLTGRSEKDMQKLTSSDEVILNYTHFSIIMSKSRKIAAVAGVNILGSDKRISRDNDQWYIDGRLLETHQYGNELYKDNRLDRGHLVRREDPVWGTDAQQANDDTFHYSNSAPQMDIFNQRVWLGLENHILKHARVDEMRVNVFTGPIFSHNDLEYEFEPENFARIPGAYWKVLAIVTEDGRPSATAYKISQERELGELEYVYGQYKTYQISIQEVIDSTDLDFGGLVKYDGFSVSELEAAQPIKVLLNSYDDIRI